MADIEHEHRVGVAYEVHWKVEELSSYNTSLRRTRSCRELMHYSGPSKVACLIQLLVFLCGNLKAEHNFPGKDKMVTSRLRPPRNLSRDICTADLPGAMEEQHISKLSVNMLQNVIALG